MHASRRMRRATRPQATLNARLVVDDEVDGAAHGVVKEPAQVERLKHDALAAERAVAVQQHRRRVRALGVVVKELLRARLAQHERVDSLRGGGDAGERAARCWARMGRPRRP